MCHKNNFFWNVFLAFLFMWCSAFKRRICTNKREFICTTAPLFTRTCLLLYRMHTIRICMHIVLNCNDLCKCSATVLLCYTLIFWTIVFIFEFQTHYMMHSMIYHNSSFHNATNININAIFLFITLTWSMIKEREQWWLTNKYLYCIELHSRIALLYSNALDICCLILRNVAPGTCTLYILTLEYIDRKSAYRS